MKKLIILLAVFLLSFSTTQALTFDGSNDYITVADKDSLDLTQMTVSAWFRQTVASQNGVISKGAGTGGTDNYLLQTWSDKKAYFSIFSVTQRQVSSGTTLIPLNQWFHLAGTYDGVTLRLYLNGQQVGTLGVAVTPTVNTGPLEIGRDNASTDGVFYFPGKIDEVRVYNRALSPSEIKSLYYGKYISYTGLVGYWPLWNNSLPFVPDLSGRKSHGSAVGSPVTTISRPPIGRYRR